jgi:hypothetical protein
MNDFAVVMIAYHVTIVLVLYDIAYWRGYMRGKRDYKIKHRPKGL